MDLTSLLKSHGDDAPSGENLEYDPAFTALEKAAQPVEERRMGDSIIPAEDPDYAEVISLAEDILQRSHDLRAGVFMADALLKTKGFAGLAAATAYLRGCLEEWWASCHPELDADDDDDPTMRVNAMRGLADATILRGIRQAPMTESRAFGRMSLRDFQIAEGEIPAPEGMDNIPEMGQISAAFQDTADEKLAEMRAAAEAVMADIKAINSVFDDKTPGMGPDLGPVEKMLKQVLSRFSSSGVGNVAGAEADGADDDQPDQAAGQFAPRAGAAPVSAAPGAINGQQDVRNTLDRLLAWYEKSEPSSPVPILLARAKRLVGADFYTIIKDIAPDGRDNVRTVGGLPDDDGE